MLNILFTVDTEIWPLAPKWRGSRLAREYEIHVNGTTLDGDFGIGYQMSLLNQHGLKGVFFVEALSASVLGLESLRETVALIRRYGHEIQLHIHTEWNDPSDDWPVPGRPLECMRNYSLDQQAEFIARGIESLQSCGVDGLRAFRAGSYGANLDTLRALSRNGLPFDSSYNFTYLDTSCGLRTREPLRQPYVLEGICEFPISHFEDWPGHSRHAQLSACSYGELKNVMLGAWRQGWQWFVIVSHGSELLERPLPAVGRASVDHIVRRRFIKLCQFISQNPDKFRTVGFGDIDVRTFSNVSSPLTVRSPAYRTAGRYAEQAFRRIL